MALGRLRGPWRSRDSVFLFAAKDSTVGQCFLLRLALKQFEALQKVKEGSTASKLCTVTESNHYALEKDNYPYSMAFASALAFEKSNGVGVWIAEKLDKMQLVHFPDDGTAPSVVRVLDKGSFCVASSLDGEHLIGQVGEEHKLVVCRTSADGSPGEIETLMISLGLN